MVVCFTVGNAIVLSLAAGRALNTRQDYLRERALILNSHLQAWETQIKTTLRVLSLNPEIRTLDPERADRILKPVYEITPTRYWRLWRADGTLLSHTGSLANIRLQERRILQDPGFQEALQGRASFRISAIQEGASLNGCMLASQPVYSATGAASEAGTRAAGVLSFCLPLNKISLDSGLFFVSRNMFKESVNSDANVIAMHRGDRTGQVFFLLSKKGHLVFPVNDSDRFSHLSLLAPPKILQGPWAPFVKLARQQTKDRGFVRTVVDGNAYHILTSRISDQWQSVELIDEQTIFAPLIHNFTSLLLAQLATLLITTVALYITCDRVARPIGKAGTAIKAISEGDFDVQLTGHYPGELGDLYRNINATGGQLRELLAQALAHASTDQQLDTAKRIQQSFLIDRLPSSEHLELAAFNEPAYEIGADWYDALSIGGFTYVVVADVCDKGIPSALFMGVFRSLVRYQITVAENRDDHARMLRDVLTSVNDYIANTHSDTVMFATVFLACFDPTRNQLTYISAGHEPTLLIQREGITRLEGGGGAIGIFPGSQYQVGSCELAPDDVLVLYTDGISDARSPEDAGFSIAGLEACLQELPPQQTAACIADHILTRVRAHIATAPQFDDMTVMVLRVL
ncbi:MAG: PP2C family protein-serine/threonine phosphatase [Cyanobium sp.]